MISLLFTYALLWALALAGPSPLSNPTVIRTRNAPGTSNADTHLAIRRALSLAERDTERESSVSLDKSWEDAVLFSYSHDTGTGNIPITNSVEVTCTTCYIKGKATSRFTIEGDFNASQAFDKFTDDVGSEISTFGEEVIEYIDNYLDGMFESFADGIDKEDFDLPPINFTFEVDLSEIAECRLEFQFDGLELYMLIDTVLSSSATYSLNLYTSNTPVGFAVGNDLRIGVTFSIDLILSVDGEVDISTGFHIKLDDGVTVDIAMFSKDVSGLTMGGGQFEFLPVTIEGAGVVFKAILRVGVHAGFEVSTPSVSAFGVDAIKGSAGVVVGVYANVAEFITNVTASVGDDDDDDDGCGLRIEQGYQLAIGANAGASVAFRGHTWGPVPETEIPIFYTTLADACAIRKSSSPTSEASVVVTSAGSLEGRADGDGDLTTTTLSTEVVYVGVSCLSEGLVNCPVSLQTTTKATTTKTLVTAVPDGEEAEFIESIRSTVASTIPFGDGARKLVSVSGSPVSYVPPPPPSATGSDNDGDDDNGSFEHGTGAASNKAFIGMCVGIGVPVLIGGIVGAW